MGKLESDLFKSYILGKQRIERMKGNEIRCWYFILHKHKEIFKLHHLAKLFFASPPQTKVA